MINIVQYQKKLRNLTLGMCVFVYLNKDLVGVTETCKSVGFQQMFYTLD